MVVPVVVPKVSGWIDGCANGYASGWVMVVTIHEAIDCADTGVSAL